MASICWLITFVILLGIELVTMALTTIWFAGGALLAFILALFGVGIEIQLVVFVVASFALLLCTRPFAAKYLNRKTLKTNVDSLIGKRAKVTETLNGEFETGVVVVNGQEWSARVEKGNDVFSVGEMVIIAGIKGVTLQVRRDEEDK